MAVVDEVDGRQRITLTPNEQKRLDAKLAEISQLDESEDGPAISGISYRFDLFAGQAEASISFGGEWVSLSE